jgi:hypothetical protein
VIGEGPITHYQNGMPFNAAGEIVGIDGPPTRYGPGATPYYDGALCGGPGTVDHWHQGVPYRADGSYVTDGGAIPPEPDPIVLVTTLTIGDSGSFLYGYASTQGYGAVAPNVYDGQTITLLVADAVGGWTDFRSLPGQFPSMGATGPIHLQFTGWGPLQECSWNATRGAYSVNNGSGLGNFLGSNVGGDVIVTITGYPPITW